MDEFEKFKKMAIMLYDFIAVCKCSHEHEELFTIPFQNQEQLESFINRNDGNIQDMGFYAQGFVKGKLIYENTNNER